MKSMVGWTIWLGLMAGHAAMGQDTTRTVFGPANYPAIALRDSLQGEVILEVRVDVNGKYRSHRVLKSDHPVLLGYVVQDELPKLTYPKPKPFGSRLVIVPFEFRLTPTERRWED